MTSMRWLTAGALLLVILIVVTAGPPVAGQTAARPPDGKPGGILKVMQREELPQGFSVHETATTSTSWPAGPCFNNLVYFDAFKKLESPDTIVGELAERWAWQDGGRTL